MKNKGFTLTEIIAVIVILAILITIGTPIYFSVSSNSRNKLYDSKIKYLSTQAEKWAEEQYLADAKLISASLLVYDGYVVADKYINDDMPFIENPLDKDNNLACRVIEIKVDGYDYIANVLDKEDCNLIEKKDKAKDMGILVFKYDRNQNMLVGSALNIDNGSTGWVNSDVAIVINPPSDAVSTRYTYSGMTHVVNDNILHNPKAGTKIVQTYSNVLLIYADTLLTTKVSFNQETNDTIKTLSLEIKIDKEPSTISSASYSGWTMLDGKHATVYVSDGNGSGVNYVYLTKDENPGLRNDYNSFKVSDGVATINHGFKYSESSQSSLDSGTYYLWTEDNVGNKSNMVYKLVISNVDSVAPTCIVKGEKTWWSSSDVLLNYVCEDLESGCSVDYNGYSKNINYSTKNVKLDSTRMVDNTGNEVQCKEVIANVYVDKEKPEIVEFNVDSKNSEYKSDTAKIKVVAKDNHGGINALCVLVDNKDIKNCNWIQTTSYNMDNNEGPKNYTFNVERFIAGYDRKIETDHQIYVYVKDTSDNISDFKSASYKPYLYCLKTIIDNNKTDKSLWGSCQGDCGTTGIMYRTQYNMDKFFNEQTCPDSVQSSSCQTEECPHNDDGGDGCGNGQADQTDGHGGWGYMCGGQWHGSCSFAGDTQC